MSNWRPDLLMMAMLAVTGCDKKTDLDIPKTEAIGVDKTRLDREAFIARADDERTELNKKIEDARKKAAEADETDKAKLAAQVRALEQEQRIAEQTREELDSAMDNRWEALKIALTESHQRLRQALQDFNAGT